MLDVRTAAEQARASASALPKARRPGEMFRVNHLGPVGVLPSDRRVRHIALGALGEGLTAASQARRTRRRYAVAALLAAVAALAAFCAITARLFIWPARGMPPHVGAIVMLNGHGNRLQTAEKLEWAHRAGALVVARGSQYWGHGSRCAARVPGIKVICFDPDPATTRGEAEFAGRLARRYRWRSIAVVTTPDQATRGRIRVKRCFPGEVYVYTAPLPARDWPWAIAYEWAAIVKALVFQRDC
jgi:uncharacterized SAM-binding protein YcdF (DUF218 family)